MILLSEWISNDSYVMVRIYKGETYFTMSLYYKFTRKSIRRVLGTSAHVIRIYGIGFSVVDFTDGILAENLFLPGPCKNACKPAIVMV